MGWFRWHCNISIAAMTIEKCLFVFVVTHKMQDYECMCCRSHIVGHIYRALGAFFLWNFFEVSFFERKSVNCVVTTHAKTYILNWKKRAEAHHKYWICSLFFRERSSSFIMINKFIWSSHTYWVCCARSMICSIRSINWYRVFLLCDAVFAGLKLLLSNAPLLQLLAAFLSILRPIAYNWTI